MWLLSGGGGWTDATDHYAVDSDANVRTFDWLKKNLVGKGLTGPVAPGKLNRKAAFAAFASGEVGMLNGHPSLLKEAAKKGVEVGEVPLPGIDGTPKSSMGVADWIMGFKQNGHRKEIGDFLNFVFTDENVLKFAGDNDLLPVTVSASTRMETDPEYANLRAFLKGLPDSQLPPVGKTSWATVSENVKQNIGKAVTPARPPRRGPRQDRPGGDGGRERRVIGWSYDRRAGDDGRRQRGRARRARAGPPCRRAPLLARPRRQGEGRPRRPRPLPDPLLPAAQRPPRRPAGPRPRPGHGQPAAPGEGGEAGAAVTHGAGGARGRRR